MKAYRRLCEFRVRNSNEKAPNKTNHVLGVVDAKLDHVARFS